ncbi:uncharacterized protein LOC132145460 [Carassius carassius]|uniref:uncharacterized protein LOC132145460 n=1 Tax=Carassius carassius TaxID=217509 RepID=UPI0028685884|nr:uncharacterized protein LOC132145460 [Carassius carassius]
MGSSLGCVKQPRDAGPGGAAPLSPKRKLRFRRKRKAKQKLKGAEGEDKRSRVLEEKESGSVEVTEGSTTKAPDSAKLISGQITTETETPTNVVLVPGMAPIFGSTGTLRGSKMAILSPDPSPAWLGALRQFEVEGLSKESHAELEQGSTTPRGGRVCKVRERVQGVLERPCLLRSKRGDLEIEKEGGDVHGQSELIFGEPSETEKKGVVHIREFGGQLCVVRTVYPRDYGSPIWRDKELEVHSEPPAASPITRGITKIQVSATQGRPPGKKDSAKPATAAARGKKGKEFLLDNSAQVAEGVGPTPQDLQSSGYASDVPLISPETGGAVQTDWGSSSDVLDSSVLESPISPQEIPAQPSTQVRFFSLCLLKDFFIWLL